MQKILCGKYYIQSMTKMVKFSWISIAILATYYFTPGSCQEDCFSVHEVSSPASENTDSIASLAFLDMIGSRSNHHGGW